jgi:hypothetical protein
MKTSLRTCTPATQVTSSPKVAKVGKGREDQILMSSIVHLTYLSASDRSIYYQ